MGTPVEITKWSLAALASAVVAALFAAVAIANGQDVAAACATRTLVVWLDTNGDAAAGSVHYELEFTNLSTRSCVLRGYPGVSAVDVAGRRLGAAAGRNARDAVRAGGGGHDGETPVTDHAS